jgi:hypothetical protein
MKSLKDIKIGSFLYVENSPSFFAEIKNTVVVILSTKKEIHNSSIQAKILFADGEICDCTIDSNFRVYIANFVSPMCRTILL